MHKPPNIDTSPLPDKFTWLQYAENAAAQGNLVVAVRPSVDGWPMQFAVHYPTGDGWMYASTTLSQATKDAFHDPEVRVAVVTGRPIPPRNLDCWLVKDDLSLELESSFVDKPTTVQERPTEFIRRPPPDMDTILRAREKMAVARRTLLNQNSKLVFRMGEASTSLDRHRSLVATHADLRANLIQREAEAFLQDVEINLSVENTEVERLAKQIASSQVKADAATEALKLLKSKSDQVEAELSELESSQRAADARWLKARHDVLFEDVCEALHNLHPVVAEILAIEDTRDWNGPMTGWKFVEAMNLATERHARWKPDWVESATPNRFPGFAAAAARLDAEISSVESALTPTN